MSLSLLLLLLLKASVGGMLLLQTVLSAFAEVSVDWRLVAAAVAVVVAVVVVAVVPCVGNFVLLLFRGVGPLLLVLISIVLLPALRRDAAVLLLARALLLSLSLLSSSL